MAENNPSPEEVNNLAALLVERRYADVEQLAQAMTVRFPHNGVGWKVLGSVFKQTGRIADAITPMRKALALGPDDTGLLTNLGNTLYELGRLDEAKANYQRALQIKPDLADAHSNLGATLQVLGRLDEAKASYQRALQIKPDYADALGNLGNTLQELGRLDEAQTSYRRAIKIKPDYAGVHSNLGATLQELGRLDEAKANYRRALQIKPDFGEAHSNLGATLHDLGRFEEAEASYRRALHIKPDYAEALANLGNTLKELGRLDAAEASYRRALQTKPDYARANSNLGVNLEELGRLDEAETSYRRALQIEPDYAEARIALVMLTLLISPWTVADAVAVSETFSRALRDFAAWRGLLKVLPENFTRSISSQMPFYLAYRDGNHVELLSRYGDLVADDTGYAPKTAPDSTRSKLRLVVVSRHFHNHSVWHIITRGLLMHLDRQRFELILYYTGYSDDTETAVAKSLANNWRDIHTVGNFGCWKDAMAADRPDIILYPELGMDPVARLLATYRLAPLQAASWGHPITSGLPTIDIFLSGEMLEPPDSDTHYREKLVRLPGTGCCTSPMEVIPRELTELRAKLASRPGARFVIAQMPFKFDPSDDALYARIAESVSDCTFILLRSAKYKWASDRVFARLSQAFRERGLHPEDYLLAIPWLSREEFYSLLELCDVYLDCPSFSGYTTAWQAVHCGLPVVTLEGKYMRQRLASGLLRKIGLVETIATSADDYVAIAANLAEESSNLEHYNTRRKAIKSAASNADNDVSVVRAFERTLIDTFAARQSLPAEKKGATD